jgi:hypothetical protein
MADLAAGIERLRENAGAKGVLTPNYALTGWLSFYLPRDVPVVQIGERYRWYQEPEPTADLLAGPLAYVDRAGQRAAALDSYQQIQEMGRITRRRSGTTIEEYDVFSVSEPDGDPLDRSPPRR